MGPGSCMGFSSELAEHRPPVRLSQVGLTQRRHHPLAAASRQYPEPRKVQAPPPDPRRYPPQHPEHVIVALLNALSAHPPRAPAPASPVGPGPAVPRREPHQTLTAPVDRHTRRLVLLSRLGVERRSCLSGLLEEDQAKLGRSLAGARPLGLVYAGRRRVARSCCNWRGSSSDRPREEARDGEMKCL